MVEAEAAGRRISRVLRSGIPLMQIHCQLSFSSDRAAEARAEERVVDAASDRRRRLREVPRVRIQRVRVK
jgi:hypothetical protein